MEATNGKTQTTNKWFNEANSTIMDMYNKQANLVLGFYSNLFHSMPGMNKNSWMPNMNFGATHDGHDFINPFTSAYSWFKPNNSFMNLFDTQYQDMYKQFVEHNNIWNSFGHKRGQEMQKNWNEATRKMQDIIEKELKIRNEAANNIIDVCNKQMDFSMELNRKFMEELNNQFNIAFKRSEKFYSDAFKETQSNEKEQKEHEVVAIKKHTKAEPVHASHHNHHKH